MYRQAASVPTRAGTMPRLPWQAHYNARHQKVSPRGPFGPKNLSVPKKVSWGHFKNVKEAPHLELRGHMPALSKPVRIPQARKNAS